MTFSFGSAPSAETYEVTLFGVGFGESIVFHANGEWFIVDSFLDPTPSQSPVPIAERYLNEIGVTENAVKLITATHWHDDHVEGISRLFEIYSQSQFACADVLTTQEFIAFAESAGGMVYSGPAKKSRLSEWRKLVNSPQFPARFVPISAGTSICRRRSPEFEIYALSPSGAENFLQKSAIAMLLPQAGPQQIPTGKGKPNHAAVVLAVRMGDRSLLLGSDLEITNQATTGWTAALKQLSDNLPWKAFFYKVAHHGSKTAHHEGIWTNGLDPDHIAGVTPFILGRHRLPTPEDVQRIKSWSGGLLQASIQRVHSKMSNSVAQTTLGRVGIKTQRYKPNLGAIRIRWKDGDPDTGVELFGSAVE